MLGVENSWPPYADRNGNGLSTSLVIAAFKATGIQTEITVKPYARVLKELGSGKIDGGYNVTRQGSTQDIFIFGNEPLLQASAYFYYSDFAFSHYSQLSDLPEGMRIGLIIDYEYGDNFDVHRHRFVEVRVKNQAQLIRMMISGRIDGAIMFERVAKHTLRGLNLGFTPIHRGFLNHISDIYVAFSPESASSRKLASALDKGVNIIKSNGVYDAIMSGKIRYPLFDGTERK